MTYDANTSKPIKRHGQFSGNPTLTWPERLKVYEALKEYIEPVEGTDKWRYKPDGPTSEALIAQEISDKIGFPVSQWQVINVRKKSFGNLHIKRSERGTQNRERITRLEQRLDALEEALGIAQDIERKTNS